MILHMYVINIKWNQMKFIEIKSVKTYKIKTKQIKKEGPFSKTYWSLHLPFLFA